MVFAAPIFVGMLGFSAFFAQALSAERLIRLPKSCEWPVGYAPTSSPHATESELSLLSQPDGPNLRFLLAFLRGWNVDAHGGDFIVASDGPGAIEVFTDRHKQHFTFNEDGDLLSAAPLKEPYSLLTTNSESKIVRTLLVL